MASDGQRTDFQHLEEGIIALPQTQARERELQDRLSRSEPHNRYTGNVQVKSTGNQREDGWFWQGFPAKPTICDRFIDSDARNEKGAKPSLPCHRAREESCEMIARC